MQQHGLGLKRQAQQRNEGCSAKVSRILELEEAAAQKVQTYVRQTSFWWAVAGGCKHFHGCLQARQPVCAHFTKCADRIKSVLHEAGLEPVSAAGNRPLLPMRLPLQFCNPLRLNEMKMPCAIGGAGRLSSQGLSAVAGNAFV
eukprot:577003-Pelagomonas_calceolata.AAC.6